MSKQEEKYEEQQATFYEIIANKDGMFVIEDGKEEELAGLRITATQDDVTAVFRYKDIEGRYKDNRCHCEFRRVKVEKPQD